ncbi:sensor histidine kinase [Sphingoaurantiacus capsulatus]|uniref:histidine kinase n=1 Tax=Sphingoaurantiacus capsulatus TaxID=1771310 RepID=A0ABV7X4X9_9SPHN
MSGGVGREAASSRILATEMRNETPGSLIGLLGLSAVTTYIHFAFRPYVDRFTLDLWTFAMAGFLTVWLLALIIVWRRRPSDEEMLLVWAPGGKITTTFCNIAVAASVWLLLPHAPDGLRLLMIVLYLCYQIVQLSIATEGTQVASSAVIMVMGSLVVWVATSGEPWSIPLALFLTMIGAMLLGVRRLIRANVVAAEMAKLRSEESEVRTREALAVVAAERDARTRFIRAASHDLAQPLQAARLFFDRYRETGDERQAAGVTRAFASTSALLDAMLTHLKLEAGAVSADPQPLDADLFIAALAFDQSPAAGEAGMHLRTPRSRLAVTADPHLLKRALDNLVANALRHSKGESVLVTARRAREGRVRFWVLDDGEGVEAGVAPRLFEDFAQGSGSSGFGIGLASVAKLAAAMGGSAGHDPRWRSGSAFWIELPAAEMPAGALSVAA